MKLGYGRRILFSMHTPRLPSVNNVVLSMVYADFLLFAAAGFLAPIYAVFITGHIGGGTLASVGFATTIFWVVKSAFQIPVALAIDKNKGEEDDYFYMMLGIVMMAAVPLLYYFFAEEMWQVYVLMAMDGFANALHVPCFLAIFTRHMDKHREGTEWMMQSNAIGLGFAAAAGIGGVIAERFGFRAILLVVSATYVLGGIALAVIRPRLNGIAAMASTLPTHRARPLIK